MRGMAYREEPDVCIERDAGDDLWFGPAVIDISPLESVGEGDEPPE
jgi:hypothetical protein